MGEIIYLTNYISCILHLVDVCGTPSSYAKNTVPSHKSVVRKWRMGKHKKTAWWLGPTENAGPDCFLWSSGDALISKDIWSFTRKN